jgi:hypothetical protein
VVFTARCFVFGMESQSIWSSRISQIIGLLDDLGDRNWAGVFNRQESAK